MSLSSIGRGLRKGLAAIARGGPALVDLLGIKKKTAIAKGVEVAGKAEAVVEAVESVADKHE